MRISLLLCAVLLALPVCAETVRSKKALQDFARTHPCPSTGLPKYHGCEGWVVDHVLALCVCHHDPRCLAVLDKPENMQWQRIDEAKKKDRREMAACRAVPRVAAK
jgi:hypothetical protein